MNTIKFVISFARGIKLRYMAAMLCIVGAAVFSFTNPLIIRFCIDSVLGSKPAQMPFFLPNPNSSTIDFIRQNFWLAGLAVVLISITAHLFTYLRSRLSAQLRRRNPWRHA